MTTNEYPTDVVIIIGAEGGAVRLSDEAGTDISHADIPVDRKNGKITWTCENGDAVVFIKGRSAATDGALAPKVSPLNDIILVVRKNTDLVTPVRKLAKSGEYDFGVVLLSDSGQILPPLDPRIIIN